MTKCTKHPDHEKMDGHCNRCEDPGAYGDTPRVVAVEDELIEVKKENEKLKSLINNPQTEDFIESVKTEAAHQCIRWDDKDKTDGDWFWTLGFLAAKTVHKTEGRKLKHWIISCAALCLNWHKAVTKR